MTKRQSQSQDNIELELSEDLVKGWIFNAIYKKFNPKSEEEAEELITKRGIHTRVITSKDVSYITIFAKGNKFIAQAREDYFLIPKQDKSCKSESDMKQKVSKQKSGKKLKSTDVNI